MGTEEESGGAQSRRLSGGDQRGGVAGGAARDDPGGRGQEGPRQLQLAADQEAVGVRVLALQRVERALKRWGAQGAPRAVNGIIVSAGRGAQAAAGAAAGIVGGCGAGGLGGARSGSGLQSSIHDRSGSHISTGPTTGSGTTNARLGGRRRRGGRAGAGRRRLGAGSGQGLRRQPGLAWPVRPRRGGGRAGPGDLAVRGQASPTHIVSRQLALARTLGPLILGQRVGHAAALAEPHLLALGRKIGGVHVIM